MAREVIPVPVPPQAPDAPAVPGADRIRSTVKIPLSTIPDYKHEGFEQRYSAWQAQGHGNGSLPEYIVWEYLVNKKGWKPGVDFYYQYPLFGGKTFYGGFVGDFYISQGNMIWNVQGLHFHLKQTKDRAKDLAAKAILSSRGYRVIFLWEDDLLERPEFVIQAALRGEQSNRHADDVGHLV